MDRQQSRGVQGQEQGETRTCLMHVGFQTNKVRNPGRPVLQREPTELHTLPLVKVVTFG